jgi:hypothetical protein
VLPIAGQTERRHLGGRHGLLGYTTGGNANLVNHAARLAAWRGIVGGGGLLGRHARLLPIDSVMEDDRYL